MKTRHSSPGAAMCADRFDLDAYLERVAYRGDLKPTRAALEALHLAHATHIPFENLDVLLQRPIRLDLASLQAKLVTGGRGGYCFEQNLLFSAGLQRLGFSVLQLAARVIYPSGRKLPRIHMLLLVDVEGATWLADTDRSPDRRPVLPRLAARRDRRAVQVPDARGGVPVSTTTHYHVGVNVAGYLPEAEVFATRYLESARGYLAEIVRDYREAGFVVRGAVRDGNVGIDRPAAYLKRHAHHLPSYGWIEPCGETDCELEDF